MTWEERKEAYRKRYISIESKEDEIRKLYREVRAESLQKGLVMSLMVKEFQRAAISPIVYGGEVL